MQQEWIVVRGVGALSGLGCTQAETAEAYAAGNTCFTAFEDGELAVSPLSASAQHVLTALLQEKPKYGSLDRSVLLAVAAAREAVSQAGWDSDEFPLGINLGSSRGATSLYEKYHADFLGSPQGSVSAMASPSTTLGNLASWVAQDLAAQGPMISHSVTCSTALQAVANGVAWLKAGMAKRFLVGGTEAPLTGFTLAQMRAIGIYSPFAADNHPCRPINGKQNTFVLGEGAAVLALERMKESELAQLPPQDRIVIAGVGMGLEQTPSKTGVSKEGLHFQKSMQEALHMAQLSPEALQALVLHAPGTKAGDAAELAAIAATFPNPGPSLYTNKSLIGHTLGASGALSLSLAIALLQKRPISNRLRLSTAPVPSPTSVLVNAAGFGGNSASVLLQAL
ncbi:beta-ketoacyl-ACP reductase [Nibribacter ruber]|uniref:Beta-ketoacyl-ACP reductase n=1 Tax=Nibribacter ruber TaxID=2698458 RepID=A0A6P1NWV0_9BACT|nr:beta-ketoacyl synthase N-terminal-like domain-containing protein [Nibribacter ruber]QHL86689.1 beta-ketoacyl-ACP reductase [Nibribacter ruber]